MPEPTQNPRREPSQPPWSLGLFLLVVIGTFLAWEAQRGHLLGALPYVLLALCPIFHLFLYRERGGEGQHRLDHAGPHGEGSLS
jgi:hypothetical protein